MKEYITKYIIDYVEEENREYHIFRKPLVGFARADSPYMDSLSEIASEGHGKPLDFMPEAKTVISYFIPFTADLNDSNKIEDLASSEWAKAYEDTNKMIGRLNAGIIEEIKGKGYMAMIPPEEYTTFNRDRIDSRWSQRHMGYAAGLGTFGINNMLITKKGCSGRLGSVITDLSAPWDEPMKEELCLYKAKGVCRICLKNCVAKALGTEGFNREGCFEICTENAKVHNTYGSSYGEGNGSEVCGKCISFSPCAYRK